MIGTTVDGQGKKHTYIGKYKNGWKEPAMEHLVIILFLFLFVFSSNILTLSFFLIR